MIKALILDLDNTIYPVSSIGEKLFAPLFKLIKEYEQLDNAEFAELKSDMMSKAFQTVAEDWEFDNELRDRAIKLLKETTYEAEIRPFREYKQVQDLPVSRFLVTKGFEKLQNSKVERLAIRADFQEVIIIDPEKSGRSKKDAFAYILDNYGYNKDEVLVIGDDPKSEIEAATELGVPTLLFDPEDNHPDAVSTYRSRDYSELHELLSGKNGN